MHADTLRAIEITVSTLCSSLGYTFQRHEGPPLRWTVYEKESEAVLDSPEKLAEYMVILTKR